METTPGTASTDEGLRLLKAGQVDQAIEVLGKTLQADSDDARAHMVIGIAYNRKGDRLHAIHHLEESVRLEESARTYYNLGLVYESANRVDEAIREYRMAVELDPSYTPAQEALKKLHDQFEAAHAKPASEIPEATVAGSPVAAAAGAVAAKPAGPAPGPVPGPASRPAAPAGIPGMPGSHPVGGPPPGAYMARQIAEQKKVEDAHKELVRSGIVYGAVCGAFIFVLIALIDAYLVSIFSGKIAFLYLLIRAGVGAVFGGLVGFWIGYTAGDEMAGVQAGAVLAFALGVVLALIEGGGFGLSIIVGVIYALFGAVGGWIIGKLVTSSIGGV